MKTILFADDSYGIRECCREELEEEGYRVVLACNGKEAIELLRTERPDLVILDIRMPRMGGLEAIEQIRGITSKIPVILFTANNENCLADDRCQLATACVEKCEDLTELKRVIAWVLNPSTPPFVRSGLPPVSISSNQP